MQPSDPNLTVQQPAPLFRNADENRARIPVFGGVRGEVRVEMIANNGFADLELRLL
jgi:hypothetical protein